MSIKDIALLLDSDVKASVAQAYGLSLAGAFGAHATGIGVALDMIVPAPMMSEIPNDVFATAFAKAKLESVAACRRFEADAAAAGIVNSSTLLAGMPDSVHDEFAALARHFDLTVVQQPNPDTLGDEEMMIEAALFRSGRPVLVIPYTQSAGFACTRVMVAWDGSVPAARALASALPILKRAGKILLVTVDERRKQADVDLPGFNISRHLARHSIAAELVRLPSAGDVANTLLSHLADSGADLLVMGAYGHSRLREFILGGATKGIMAAMTVPVLMAH
jgi:nucleotide-binding universal stress UspA family protein